MHHPLNTFSKSFSVSLVLATMNLDNSSRISLNLMSSLFLVRFLLLPSVFRSSPLQSSSWSKSRRNSFSSLMSHCFLSFPMLRTKILQTDSKRETKQRFMFSTLEYSVSNLVRWESGWRLWLWRMRYCPRKMQGLKRLRTSGSICSVLFISSSSSFESAIMASVRVGSSRSTRYRSLQYLRPSTVTVSRFRLSNGTWKSICLNSSTKRSASFDSSSYINCNCKLYQIEREAGQPEAQPLGGARHSSHQWHKAQQPPVAQQARCRSGSLGSEGGEVGEPLEVRVEGQSEVGPRGIVHQFDHQQVLVAVELRLHLLHLLERDEHGGLGLEGAVRVQPLGRLHHHEPLLPRADDLRLLEDAVVPHCPLALLQTVLLLRRLALEGNEFGLLGLQPAARHPQEHLLRPVHPWLLFWVGGERELLVVEDNFESAFGREFVGGGEVEACDFRVGDGAFVDLEVLLEEEEFGVDVELLEVEGDGVGLLLADRPLDLLPARPLALHLLHLLDFCDFLLAAAVVLGGGGGPELLPLHPHQLLLAVELHLDVLLVLAVELRLLLLVAELAREVARTGRLVLDLPGLPALPALPARLLLGALPQHQRALHSLAHFPSDYNAYFHCMLPRITTRGNRRITTKKVG